MQKTNASTTSRTLRIVRWILAIILLLDFGLAMSHDPYPDQPPAAYVAIRLLTAVSILLASFRPGLGTALSIVPLALAHATGHGLQGFYLMLAIPFAACATASTPVIVATLAMFTGNAIIAVIIDGTPIAFFEHAMIVGAAAFGGVVVRSLHARHLLIGSHIRDLERRSEETRAAERRALAAELSDLLSTGLADQRRLVAEARERRDPSRLLSVSAAAGDPRPGGSAAAMPQDQAQTLATTLDRLAAGSRDALAQLRSLISTLRNRPETGAPGPRDDRVAEDSPHAQAQPAGLVAMAEEIDDLLTGHGHAVELDVSEIAREPSDFARRIVADLLREAAQLTLDAATPGASCSVRLTSDDDGVVVEVAAPGMRPSLSAVLTQTAGRLRETGGVLETTDGGRIRAVLPSQPTPVAEDAARAESPDDPVGGRRFERALRWAGTVVSTIGVLGILALNLFVLPADAEIVWTQDGLWLLTFIGFGLACWRPLPGAAVLAIAALIRLWWLDPQAAIGQPDFAFIGATAILVAHRRRLFWPVLAVSLAHAWVWFTIDEVYRAFFITFVGAGLGLAGRHFIRLRDAQRTRLGQAAQQHRRARDEVRRELSGELHDIVAHQLTLIGLQVEAQRGVSDPATLRAAIDRIDAILQSTQTDLALLLHVLDSPETASATGTTAANSVSPAPAALLTLIAAADAAAATLQDSGRFLQLNLDPDVSPDDPTTQRTLVRIVRESTTNILRYSPAQSHSTLDLTRDDHHIRIRITSPLPSRPVRSADSTGLGLIGLEERVRLTGGTLTASAEDGMWVVDADLPAARS